MVTGVVTCDAICLGFDVLGRFYLKHEWRPFKMDKGIIPF